MPKEAYTGMNMTSPSALYVFFFKLTYLSKKKLVTLVITIGEFTCTHTLHLYIHTLHVTCIFTCTHAKPCPEHIGTEYFFCGNLTPHMLQHTSVKIPPVMSIFCNTDKPGWRHKMRRGLAVWVHRWPHEEVHISKQAVLFGGLCGSYIGMSNRFNIAKKLQTRTGKVRKSNSSVHTHNQYTHTQTPKNTWHE